MVAPRVLQKLAKEHGTSLFVIDHKQLRKQYHTFRKHLPRVQAYYAVKANSDPAIVQTLYEAGASFDVASLAEFHLVHQNIESLPAKQRQDFIWDKIIYANPIKDNRTLVELDPYKPLMTYDNHAEIAKIKKHAPHAGLILRLRVPNTGAVVELLARQGLPDRRPFRARRRHDVIDPKLAKCLQDRLAAVEIILHLVLAPGFGGTYQHPNRQICKQDLSHAFRAQDAVAARRTGRSRASSA
jgi:hypothetical protein